jgi:predicted transcriptional regulator
LINLSDELKQTISLYRSYTYRTRPGMRISSCEEAVQFFNQSGFVFFWPVKGIILPSLWVATAGDRPVPDAHDDPGQITWDWKDSLLGKKRVYYSRTLRQRNTFISLNMLPYFYALSPNFGDWEHDYLDQYYQGTMTAAARSVYEALLREGPLNTLALRKASNLSSSTANGLFSRALNDLMAEFKVLPVGVSDAGAWHYSHIYDITARHYSDIQEKSRNISEDQARVILAGNYFKLVGISTQSDIQKLFGWHPEIMSRTLQKLAEKGIILPLEDPENSNPPLWRLKDLSVPFS